MKVINSQQITSTSVYSLYLIVKHAFEVSYAYCICMMETQYNGMLLLSTSQLCVQ